MLDKTDLLIEDIMVDSKKKACPFTPVGYASGVLNTLAQCHTKGDKP